MHPASEKGHMIVSHREQSCSVQKTSWGCLGCHFVYVVWFYHVHFFFCSWESHRKSPVAVAFSVQQNSVYISCSLTTVHMWKWRENTQANSIFSAVWYCFGFFSFNCSLKNKSLWEHAGWVFLIFFNKMTHKKQTVTYHILLGVGTQQCLSGFAFYQQRATAGRNLTR